MKKILFILPLLLILTACADYKEIEELTITSMFCIEKTKDGQIEFTAEIITLDGDKPKGTVISVVSPDLSTALYKADILSSKRLYWSHNNIIILGERLAREDFSNILQFLDTNQEIRLNSHVILANGFDPKEIFEEKGDKILGFELSTALNEAVRVSRTVNRELYEIISEVMESGMTVMSSINKDFSFGCAAVSDYKLIDFLSDGEINVFLRLNKELNRTIVRTETAVFEVISSKTKRKIREENGDIFIDIKINDNLKVLKYTGKKDLYKPEEIKKLERMAAEVVASQIIKELGNFNNYGDILRIRSILKKLKIKTEIKEDFSNLHFNFSTKSFIGSTGFVTNSIKRGGEVDD